MKSSNFRRTLEDLYWGADLHLLNVCTEEKARFIRYEINIILISVLFGLIIQQTQSLGIGMACGLFVFFLYKMFLSNLNMVAGGHTHEYSKFLIGLVLSVVLTLCVGSHFRLPFPWDYFMIEIIDCVYWGISLIISMILCFIPIRLSSLKDSMYGKMLTSEREKDEGVAKAVMDTNKAMYEENVLRHEVSAKAKKEILKAADKEYIATMAHEIAQARIRLAQFALQKWEEEQRKQIKENVDHYIKK